RAASWGELADKEKDHAKKHVKVLPPPSVHPASQTTATISPPALPKRNQDRRVNSAEDTNTTSLRPPSPQAQVNGSDAKYTKAIEKSVVQEGSKDLTLPAQETPSQAITSEPEPESLSTPSKGIPTVPVIHPASDTLTEVPADTAPSTVVSAPTSIPVTPRPAPPPAASVKRSAVAPPLPRRASARGPRPMSFRRIPDPPAPTTVTVDAEFANPSVPVTAETSTKTLTSDATKPVDEAVTVTPDGTQHAVEPQAENLPNESSRETEAVPVIPP